jgi:hypothetical protein
MSLDLHSDTHMHSTYSDGSATIASMDWYITIASVHTLVVGTTPCLVNGNETEFHTCLNNIFNKDIRSLCRAYYHTLQEAQFKPSGLILWDTFDRVQMMLA